MARPSKPAPRRPAASPKPRPTEKFTRAEQRHIRAHIIARGMTFQVFLPESLANWLRRKIRAGVYEDPAQAAFLAFQDLQELDRHPEVRKHLFTAMIQSRAADAGPGIPGDQVMARLRARERRYARTEPPRPKPLPKRRVSLSKKKF